MIGHNRIDERMDEKVSRDLMTGLMGEETGEEGKDVLIVRVLKDTQRVKRRRSGNDRRGLARNGNNREWMDMLE